MIIRLDEPTECGEMCKIIQKVIDRHVKATGSPAQALSIKVVDITDQTIEIPKLEMKDEDNNKG